MTETIDSSIPGRWQEYDGESEAGFRQYKDRVYPIPQAGTLAGTTVNMQEGDTLPDDTTYEIISAEIKMVRPLTGTTKHKGGRAAVLRAVKEKVEGAAQTPWKELSGTREVNDSDPQVIRYAITFTANTATSLPANGQILSDVIGSGSLPSTNLDREPVIVNVLARIKATVLKDHVTCVFEARHARTITGSPWTEINPRTYVRTGRNSAKGRLRFSGPVASESAMENALYGSVYPGRSGRYAPKCNRVEIVSHQWPGRSLVIADYETPRIVGEGKLRIEVGYETDVITEYVQDGKTYKIGPEQYKDPNGKDLWGERRIVSGSNIKLKPKNIIILETAATSFNINTYQNRVGCVNKYNLPNFGNAQPGTLLFLGLPHTMYRLVGNLWYLNLAWKYSGDPTLKIGEKLAFPKWNKMTKSQLGVYVARKLQGVDSNGDAVDGAIKYISEWVPRTLAADGSLKKTDSEKIPHANFPVVDFRAFGKTLTITGIG